MPYVNLIKKEDNEIVEWKKIYSLENFDDYVPLGDFEKIDTRKVIMVLNGKDYKDTENKKYKKEVIEAIQDFKTKEPIY